MNSINNSPMALTWVLVLVGVIGVFESNAGYRRTVGKVASTGASASAPQEVVVANTPLLVTGQVGVSGTPSVIVANPVSIDPTNNTVTLASTSDVEVHEPGTIVAYDQTVSTSFGQYFGPVDVSAFKQIRVIVHYVEGTTNYSVQPVIPLPDSSVITAPLDANPIQPGQGTVSRVYTPLCQNIKFVVAPNPPNYLKLRILVYGRQN